jgi:hypothetical protein
MQEFSFAHLGPGARSSDKEYLRYMQEQANAAEAAEAQDTAAQEEAPENAAAPAEAEDVHYQAVEKDGAVTAIWEMQGRKHLRTIDPRSSEGKQILALFETAG